MRPLRHGLELALLIAVAMVGCANRDISLRPPKRPDELVVPPVADARFSNPPRYPESLNQDIDPDRRGVGQNTPNIGAMNMGGMGRGMGGMGGMGGGGMGGMGMGGMGGMGMGGNMLGGYGR